jgi:predicted ATP-grasp superfamily ATP-dependent carboligase
MRILVFEFVSGGGLAGRDVPASLAREGAAMRTALVADLASIGGHEIVTTAEARFPLAAPRGVEVVTLSARPGPMRLASQLDGLIESVDAVWLVAPETDRCLERLTAKVERQGKILLGSGAAAIRGVSDKGRLARGLARRGVDHPETCVLPRGMDYRVLARNIGYPIVVKPTRGAGCTGVCLARNPQELRYAVEAARGATVSGALLLQRYVPGAAASVSLLADGRRVVPLAVNAQCLRKSRPFSYGGGITPLEHPLAHRAVEVAMRACEAWPGLRGYVGVDLVLTESEAVVIEVNPRLTTAYLGLRSAIRENIAALALAACAGALPLRPQASRRVRFTATGRIVSNVPHPSGPDRRAGLERQDPPCSRGSRRLDS